MAEGQGNITYGSARGAGGGGGGIVVNGARNGLTVDAGGFIVLGEDTAAAGQPGRFLSNREEALNGFALQFNDMPSLQTNFFEVNSSTRAMLNFFKGTGGQQIAEIITVQGQNPGVNPYGNFWLTLDESFTNPDGQIDAVLQMGYNQTGGGGPVVLNEAAIWWAMESHFQAGGGEHFEIHLQSVSKLGDVNRHISLDVDKDSGACEGFITASTWSFFDDNTGTNPYLDMSGPGGTLNVRGTSPQFQMINLDPVWGQVAITSNADGSVNITNSTTSANNTFQFSNALSINNSNAAFASIQANLPNIDDIEGFFAEGTITAGGGNAFPFLANITSAGAALIEVDQLGTGDAYLAAVSAVGGGNAVALFKNANNSDSYTLGLHQSDAGKFKIAQGTAISATNLLTITATGQIGVGGNTTPSALLHIASSPGTAGNGPFKLSPGPLLATPEDGLFEYFAGILFFTSGATRKTVMLV